MVAEHAARIDDHVAAVGDADREIVLEGFVSPDPSTYTLEGPFSEYPGKGRATGGVRSHRFLKGEDTGWDKQPPAPPGRRPSAAGQGRSAADGARRVS